MNYYLKIDFLVKILTNIIFIKKVKKVIIKI